MAVTPASLLRAILAAAICATTPAVLASLDRAEADATLIRDGAVDDASAYTHTLGTDGLYRVSTRFTSFDGDPLRIGFAFAERAARDARHRFGVSRAELDALVDTCVRSGACNQATLDRQLAHYYRERGLRMKQGDGRPTRLFVDVPLAVRRNRADVEPLATALRRLAADRGRGTEWAIEAAVALVQTGLPYRQPGEWDGGRKIVGFYPPARALEQGYGDCDTKSALLASILVNLTQDKLVGIHVPKHYLLGIAGRPLPGQASIRHAGQTYVLVEAAGPAMRRPGEVADTTLAALRAGKDIRVDPI
jgi:hypothetical protein